MVTVAASDPEDMDLNHGLFAVSNSNKKLSVTNNTNMLFSSKYCSPAIEGIFAGINNR